MQRMLKVIFFFLLACLLALWWDMKAFQAQINVFWNVDLYSAPTEETGKKSPKWSTTTKTLMTWNYGYSVVPFTSTFQIQTSEESSGPHAIMYLPSGVQQRKETWKVCLSKVLLCFSSPVSYIEIKRKNKRKMCWHWDDFKNRDWLKMKSDVQNWHWDLPSDLWWLQTTKIISIRSTKESCANYKRETQQVYIPWMAAHTDMKHSLLPSLPSLSPPSSLWKKNVIISKTCKSTQLLLRQLSYSLHDRLLLTSTHTLHLLVLWRPDKGNVYLLPLINATGICHTTSFHMQITAINKMHW